MIQAIRNLLVLRADRSGSAMVEFVFALAILMPLIVGVIEIGRTAYHHHIMDKGLRAATRYLTRVDAPGEFESDCSSAPTGAALAAKNIAIYGLPEGGTDPLLDYWDDYALICIDGPFTHTIIDENGDDLDVAVVRMRSTVSFDDLGVLALIGLDEISLTAIHEERHIGE